MVVFGICNFNFGDINFDFRGFEKFGAIGLLDSLYYDWVADLDSR